MKVAALSSGSKGAFVARSRSLIAPLYCGRAAYIRQRTLTKSQMKIPLHHKSLTRIFKTESDGDRFVT